MAVTEFLWLELIWIIDWWAGIKVFSKFDPELCIHHPSLKCSPQVDFVSYTLLLFL